MAACMYALEPVVPPSLYYAVVFYDPNTGHSQICSNIPGAPVSVRGILRSLTAALEADDGVFFPGAQ